MEDQKSIENEVLEKPADKLNVLSKDANSSRKAFLVGILVVIALVIVSGLLIYILKKGTQELTNTVVPPGQNFQESLVTTSNYLESQKNQDGSYAYQAHADEICPKVNGVLNCKFSPDNISVAANSWAALGHYSSYKITLDFSQLDRAKRDLEQLMNYCEDTSNNCLYLLTQPAIITKDIKDAKVNEFLKSQAEKLTKSLPSENIMLIGIEVRELALLSQVLNDVNLKLKAQERMKIAESLLQKQSQDPATGNAVFPNFACWVALAQVELGIATNDTQKITNAAEYVKQNDRINVINNYENPVMIQPCIETLALAGKQLANSYSKDAKDMFDVFENNFYDNPTSKLIYGESGTTYYPKRMLETGSAKHIFLADSAYTNYLKYLTAQ